MRHRANAAIATAAVLATGLVGLGLGLQPRPGRILPGVRVWGTAVGDLTPLAARRVVIARASAALDRRVALVDGGRRWEVSPRELGCSLDVDAAVSLAEAVGRRGHVFQRIWESWTVRRHGVDLRPRWSVNRKALARHLRRIARAARIPARDARIRFTGRGFLISRERPGHRVDPVETEKNILRYFDVFGHRQVALVSGPEVPRLKASDLREIRVPLRSYVTRFNPGDVNRTENLRLAARALNGTVVPAGAVFSYNEAVGPRSQALGYRVAKIFLKGEIIEGVGGGVCQVASTLYNAARESRLPVIERARHSRPVTYVPPGRDATVSFGGVDLRFRNTTGAPILVVAYAGRSRLSVTLFGSRRYRQYLDRVAAERSRQDSG